MSILLMANVMELDIQTGAKFILLVMANFASDEGENVYPSHETIARLTNMTRRTVVSTVKQLVDDGYVKLDGKKGNRQNIYSLNVDKIMDGGAQVRKIFTPEGDRCETVSQNPLSIKELKDLNDLKDLKDSSGEIFAQQQPAKFAQYEMMKALADASRRVLKDNAPMLGRYAKQLISSRYTPEDVNEFVKWWYRSDWRGKKGQAPTPAQVKELIGTSKWQTKSNQPTQEEIDRAMQEISWEDER